MKLYIIIKDVLYNTFLIVRKYAQHYKLFSLEKENSTSIIEFMQNSDHSFDKQ